MLTQETWGTPNKFVFCILPHRNMHMHCTWHTCYRNLWKHDDLSSGKGETFRDMQSSWWQVRSSFLLVVQQQFSQPLRQTDQNSSVFVAITKFPTNWKFWVLNKLQFISINTLCYHLKVRNFTVFPFLSEWHNIPFKKKKKKKVNRLSVWHKLYTPIFPSVYSMEHILLFTDYIFACNALEIPHC